MKKLLSIAIVFLAVSLVHSQVVSTDKIIGDYKKDVETLTKYSKEVGKFDTYKKISLKNNKTDEVKKFTELSEFDKNIFCLFQRLKFEDNLRKLQYEWVGVFKKLNTDDDKGKADDPDTAIAKANHVSKSLDNLFELRKQVAFDTEAAMEKLFKDYPEKFDEKEKELTLKQLKETHDKEKLIKR